MRPLPDGDPVLGARRPDVTTRNRRAALLNEASRKKREGIRDMIRLNLKLSRLPMDPVRRYKMSRIVDEEEPCET